MQIVHGNGQPIVTPLNHSLKSSLSKVMYTIRNGIYPKSMFLLNFDNYNGAPERIRTCNPWSRRPEIVSILCLKICSILSHVLAEDALIGCTDFALARNLRL